jgi:hypothetical protein
MTALVEAYDNKGERVRETPTGSNKKANNGTQVPEAESTPARAVGGTAAEEYRARIHTNTQQGQG